MIEDPIAEAEFSPDEVGASVLHRTDSTVLAEGFGRFAEPGRGQRLSYVRPGGVLIGIVEGVRTVRPWAVDYVPTLAEVMGR
jgi:hypothetical protein